MSHKNKFLVVWTLFYSAYSGPFFTTFFFKYKLYIYIWKMDKKKIQLNVYFYTFYYFD